MADHLINAVGWYNEANHSDFTLGLSDGTKIHAHKIILCSNNKRFERICGDMTSHAKPVSIIHPSESAEVIRVLVGRIYGLPVSDTDAYLAWGFWVDLAMAAKDYLESDFSELAIDNSLDLARDMSEVREIINMIEVVEGRNVEELHEAATLVRKHHGLAFLEDDGYIAAYVQSPDLVKLYTVDLLAKHKDLAARHNVLSDELKAGRIRALGGLRSRKRVSH